MNCIHCNSEKTHRNGRTRDGQQQYKCNNCGKYFYEGQVAKIKSSQPSPRPIEKKKLGITAKDLRAKYDVDYIVLQTLKKLERDRFYLKDEVRQLTGLRAGFPGLSAALDAVSDYYGRADGKNYYSHLDSIAEMKSQAILT